MNVESEHIFDLLVIGTNQQ